MLEQLELLLELQRIDTELAELSSEHESLPVEIAELEGKRREANSEVEQRSQKLDETKKERQRRERDLEDATAKLGDLKSKQLMIKTNEEYAALTHEIGFAEKEISDIEDVILRLLEDVEELTADLEGARATADAAVREVDAGISDLRARLTRLDDAVAVKKDERLRVAMRLDGTVRERYERLLESKGDSALAFVTGGACSGCYKSLPPQTVIEVKRASDFVECDGCGRILVWRKEGEVG